jgi:ABC-type sugar transport system ATPase subunit
MVPMSSTIFEAVGVSRAFGPVQALSDVTLGIRRGELHAVIGENGAGKSTLMNIFCGRLAPSRGVLRRDGSPIHFRSPIDAQAASIAMAPQEINLVPFLSVAENIMLGSQIADRLGRIDWKATRDQALSELTRLDESFDLDQPVGELPKAQQQLVQIARAVATKAEILIFDEPTAALTDREADKLFAFLRSFKAQGGAAFYISHRLDEILAIADTISVMRDGRLVATLDPRATGKAEMVRFMAGQEVAFGARKKRTINSSDIILEVRGLTRHGEFRDVSFDLRRGEVLGIAGLVGSGRTEIGRCLFGVTRRDAGTVLAFGEPLDPSHPADAIARGLVYLPEERKHDGIFPLLSIAENMTLPSHARFSNVWRMNFAEMIQQVEAYVRQVGIKVGSPGDAITTLSGGNQQKVILARWLLRGSKILFLDEPTRGIDVKAKSEIQRQFQELAAAGLSIIYVSSELQEVIDVADRILVIHEGEVKGIVDAKDTTQEHVLHLAMS